MDTIDESSCSSPSVNPASRQTSVLAKITLARIEVDNKLMRSITEDFSVLFIYHYLSPFYLVNRLNVKSAKALLLVSTWHL